MVQTVFQINKNTITGVQPKIKIKQETRVKILYKEKTCNYPGCNNKFIPQAPHQLYCSAECRYYSDVDHTLKRVRNFRKRYKDVLKELPNYVSTSIGTGHLGEHMCSDVDEEEQKIRMEIRRLGLTSVSSY